MLSSHYHSLVNLILLYSFVIISLESIDDTTSAKRREAVLILEKMRIFEFVFSIHLMRNILGLTSELFLALQKKRSRYCECHGPFGNSQAAVSRNKM